MLSLNQTLGPDLLLIREIPPVTVGDSLIFEALVKLMKPSSVNLKMSAPVESTIATSPKELVCKVEAPVTFKLHNR